jgi:hypothetical protein
MTTKVRERPIIFSGVMVRALLDGRKSQTRRVIKPRPDETFAEMSATTDFGWQTVGHSWRWTEDSDPGGRAWTCPHGVPGDRLWVREAFYDRADYSDIARIATNRFAYVADGIDGKRLWIKHSPIHMPRIASRITLEVTSVRAERVQDISERDAWSEGFPDPPGTNRDYPDRARYWFRHYWDLINIKRPGYAWADNPWVWVVEFRSAAGPPGEG